MVGLFHLFFSSLLSLFLLAFSTFGFLGRVGVSGG